MHKWLEDAVRNGLRELVGQSVKRRLRLSSISDCPRRQWLSVREGSDALLDDVDEAIDEERVGIYAAGLVWERVILDILNVPAEQRQVEVDIFGIKGHIDGVAILNGTPLIVDVKTTSLALIESAPFRHHIWQVRAYAVGYKEKHGACPHVALIYIAREKPISINPSSPKAWIEPYSEEWELSVKEVAKILTADEIPPIPPTYAPDRLPCQGIRYGRHESCPFLNQCWGTMALVPLSKCRYLDADKTAVDKAGEQHHLSKTLRDGAPYVVFEEAIRSFMKERPEVEEVRIEGEEWCVIGRRRRQRTFNVHKATALLRQMGMDVDDFYEVKDVVYITWQRLKGTTKAESDSEAAETT